MGQDIDSLPLGGKTFDKIFSAKSGMPARSVADLVSPKKHVNSLKQVKSITTTELTGDFSLIAQTLTHNHQLLLDEIKHFEHSIPQQLTRQMRWMKWSILVLALGVGLSILLLLFVRPTTQIKTVGVLPFDYVATQYVNLRSGPTAEKKNLIATLPPNTGVKLLELKKGWAKIQVQNLLTKNFQEGWVYSPGIQKLK